MLIRLAIHYRCLNFLVCRYNCLSCFTVTLLVTLTSSSICLLLSSAIIILRICFTSSLLSVTRHYEYNILVVDKGESWDTTHTLWLCRRAKRCPDRRCGCWSRDLPRYHRGHPGCCLLQEESCESCCSQRVSLFHIHIHKERWQNARKKRG